MYSDDKTAIISGEGTVQFKEYTNIFLGKMYEWFYGNGLCLNRDKTNYVVINLAWKSCNNIGQRSIRLC